VAKKGVNFEGKIWLFVRPQGGEGELLGYMT